MYSKKDLKVIRVNRKEFELSDGRIFPHPIELDETLKLSDFKKYFQYWKELLSKENPFDKVCRTVERQDQTGEHSHPDFFREK